MRVGRWLAAGFAAAVLVALAAPAAFAWNIDNLKVSLWKQDCANGFQHSRVVIKNHGSDSVTVYVADPTGRVRYEPPGPIKPGGGMAAHLTSPPGTPTHNATVSIKGGGSTEVEIPDYHCPVPPTPPPTPPNKPPTGGNGPPVVVAGAVDDPGSSSGTATKAGTTEASGVLPFTGSDARALAAMAAFLVVVGVGFVVAQLRLDGRQALMVGELPRRGVIGPL